MKIAVLMGGDTAEREVSLDSGAAVVKALQSAGHDVHGVVLGRLMAEVVREPLMSADVVFIALHGGAGEDGRVQAVLDQASLPYVGCGPAASALCMDKVWSKLLCRSLGVPTSDWTELPADPSAKDIAAAAALLGWPLVLKPVDEGSAIGVHILKEESDASVFEVQAPWRGLWMLERYVAGSELTVPVLWNEAMAIVEIRPESGFYDYEHKYTKGRSEYHCPAPLAANVAQQVTDYALRFARAARATEMARIDFRLDSDGNAFFLEANTIPGMTEVSLLPMGAAERGIDFVEMCDRLCRNAYSSFHAGSGDTP